ncbi:MAG: bile acid:sodium symporter [Rubrivivax sp.]|nr:MAG: bile acid:sodium symporter [Rubrivivax sp.]
MQQRSPSALRGAADWFLIGMVAAVLLASLAPQLGRTGGTLHLDQIGNVGIFAVFFLHGMGLSTDSLRQGASRWRLHLVVQVFTFVAFPLWWWLLSLAFGGHLPHDLLLGFFYLAVLPSTVSSSVTMTGLARGNVAAAILNATLSTLLGVFLTPMLASLVFGDHGGTGHDMELGDTMLKVARLLLLPFVLGQALRPWLGDFFKRIKSKTTLVDKGVILLLVWCSFSDSVADGLWTKHGLGLIGLTLVGAALFLFPMLWFTKRVAKAMGFPVEDEIVAVFCGSKKTLASGVPMARLLFGGDPALGVLVLPIMFYHQLQLLVCSVMARRYAARAGGDMGQPPA